MTDHPPKREKSTVDNGLHSSSTLQQMLQRIKESSGKAGEKEQSKLSHLQNILQNVKKSRHTNNLMKTE